MGDAFDSSARNFGELLGKFQSRQIVVPQFQRGYSWENAHVATFWGDLLEFQRNASKDSADRYFLGPIVTLDENNKILLLDGQQRLATATILFAAIRDIGRGIGAVAGNKGSDLARDIQRDLIAAKEDEAFSLELGETDASYFRATIQNDPPFCQDPVLRSHKLIKATHDFLTTSLKGETQKMEPAEAIKWLDKLKNTVASRMTMVDISVRSEDDAYMIFETLNDRGLRLSVPDLVLNYLIRTADEEKEKRRIRELWNSMLDRMGRRDIDRFFRHMWLSKYGDVKSRGLFREIKLVLKGRKIASAEFAESCASECSDYVAIVDLDSKRLGRAHKYVRGVVEYLDIPSSLPLLLSGLRCLKPSHFQRLARFVVELSVRHSILANLNPSDLESAFYNAAREIRAQREAGGTSAKCLNAARALLASINPKNDQLYSNVDDLTLLRNEPKYLLTEIANSLQSKTKEVAIDDANVEHIFPRNPSPEWKNANDLRALTWHLGNLTILGTRLNNKIGNSGFKRKCVVYQQSEIQLTQEIPGQYKRWTPTEVVARARNLVKIIEKMWQGP